jgi:hypothetical protein
LHCDILVSHTAADLHLKIGLPQDALDDRNVGWAATACTLEVDDVKPLGTLVFEPLSHGNRVVIIDRDLVILALVQPHDLAVEQVDRWNPRKCPIKRAPACWLFSGWNWHARTFSRAMAEQNGPP